MNDDVITNLHEAAEKGDAEAVTALLRRLGRPQRAKRVRAAHPAAHRRLPWPRGDRHRTA